MTHDNKFIHVSKFNDTFYEYIENRKANGKDFFDVDVMLTNTGVICNFTLTENYFSKSTHKFNTHGFKLEFNTQQIIEIQGFPK